MELDQLDKNILQALHENARTPATTLAKKFGTSRPVIEYRINRLLENNTIYELYTLIDPGKLGFSSYRLHIRVNNIPYEKYREFAQQLLDSYPVHWIAFMSGSFDIIVDILARTPNAFNEIHKNIVQEHNNIIRSYETLTMLQLQIYTLTYFADAKPARTVKTFFDRERKRSVDETDINILQALRHDARKTYTALEKDTEMTRQTNKQRLESLEQQEIIQGYGALIDFNQLGYNSHKIFIRYRTDRIDQEGQLLSYLKEQDNVLATVKLLGKWNLDIEIHTKDSKQLQQFIIELRGKFDIINEHDICEIIEDYGITFFPDKLAELL